MKPHFIFHKKFDSGTQFYEKVDDLSENGQLYHRLDNGLQNYIEPLYKDKASNQDAICKQLGKVYSKQDPTMFNFDPPFFNFSALFWSLAD